MKPWNAILFSVGLAMIGVVISGLTGVNVVWIIVLASAVWVSVDSQRIQIRRYQSGIAYGPLTLFFACALLWIVAFPWYLSVRYKIKAGTAVLNEGVKYGPG